MVCSKDWEARHPSTMYKYHSKPSVPAFIRKDSADTFVTVCTLSGSSGYADLAEADCAQADNDAYTYSFLIDLTGNGYI